MTERMSSTKRFSRMLSLRGDRHRNRSSSRPGTASSPFATPDLLGVFTAEDSKRRLTKDEEKKLIEIKIHLGAIGMPDVPDSRMEYALRVKSSDGDVKKAVKFLVMLEDATAGIITRYDPNVQMLGAENRHKVTCYLDSLLFAMFAKPDVFEAILFKSFEDEPRRRLVTLIRLWVNMLRSGRLITVDIMQKLQESLAECGWADAAKIHQQDASEAFCFITDKLELPLLTLQTDLFHAGKVDNDDDHKFITERMLDVAIPEDIPEGETITLEKCLEEYFNNRVEVKRHLLRKTTNASISSIEKVSPAVHVEVAEADSSTVSTPIAATPAAITPLERPGTLRERAMSIFSERRVEVIEAEEEALDTDEKDPGLVNGHRPARARTNSIRKEVMMPAWQFINLIPWYSDNHNSRSGQTSAHFSSRRPMLGICLKRYKVSPDGNCSRLDTHVDIPLEMSPPHFASGEGLQPDDGPPTSSFKLVLQSVVCHRGVAVDSGHYISLLRAPQSMSNSFVDAQEDQANGERSQARESWLCFDDLAKERVRRVDIVKSLRDESPYLLFYRVQPVDEECGFDSPPPYSESSASLDLVDQKLAAFNDNANGNRSSLDVPAQRSAASPRISFELSSTEQPPTAQASNASTRRGSNTIGPVESAGSTTGSLGTTNTSAEPPSPLEESKTSLTAPPSGFMSRKRSSNKGSMSSDKRLSGTWHIIAAKLSRDKLAQMNGSNGNAVVNTVGSVNVSEEAIDDRTPNHAHSLSKEYLPNETLANGTRSKPNSSNSNYPFAPPLPPKPFPAEKLQEKLKKNGKKSRGGSNHDGTERVRFSRSKKPDRECVMM